MNADVEQAQGIMTSQTYLGKLFVLVGPGGVGKNAILKMILERMGDVHQLATATTRAPRSGEQHGKQRLFVTHAEFKQMLANNELAEHEEVHTGDFYGVPRTSLEIPFANGQDLIADIDIHGANTLRGDYPNNIVLIFVTPPGNSLTEMLDVLEDRLEARQATEEQTHQRLKRAPEELLFAPHCDYLVVNENLEDAVEVVRGIILAERSRRALMSLRARTGLPQHHFGYAASVIPVYQDDVLYHRDGKHFPTDKVLVGELPHETALRLVRTVFGINGDSTKLRSRDSAFDSEFVSPILLQYQDQRHEELVIFDFIYVLDERIQVHGWEWASASEVAPHIVDALAGLKPERSTN
jgi:guanylate kinase